MTMKEIKKRVSELEKPETEENTARIIIYDPTKGAPVIPEADSDRVVFLLPDNKRDV